MSDSDRMLRVVLFCAVILFASLGIYGTRPPTALGPNAPLDQFSATRAITHLSHFADQPHPIGSAANEHVRDYLVGALRELGAEVHLEETTGIHLEKQAVLAGKAANIVARWRGRNNHRAVLLMAHYDSVPQGPGAADDGAGVICALETARAIHAGSPLANDLIVLLTDGEEAGLLGASGFVADHPDLAQRVALVVNLEARGSSGPALMFETSEGNGALIPSFARAALYPMASSLMYSVYKRLPNDTDLTAFKPTGIAAFNFAFTETFQDYHSRLDTAERLDLRSVQQMGANLLGLVRHFGNLSQRPARQPDCIYFNWIGQRLFVYPVWAAWGLAALTYGLLAAAFVIGRRDGQLRWSWAALGTFFFGLFAVSAGMLLAWGVIVLARGDALLQGDTPSNRLLLAGLILVGFVSGGATLALTSKRLGVRTQAWGMLLVISLLAVLVLFLLPGASYLLQWPALLGAGCLLLVSRARARAMIAFCGMLAAAPALLILAALGYLLFVGLDLNLASLLANALLLTLLLAVAWPLFDFLFQPGRGLRWFCGLTAVLLLACGIALSHPSAEHPRRDALFYSLNAHEGKAKWISTDRTVDAWTRQFLGTNPASGSQPAFTLGAARSRLAADAPFVRLPAPVATRTGDRRESDGRVLNLHLQSPRGATSLMVTLPNDVELEAVGWNCRSRAVPAAQVGRWLLRYEGVPAAGVDLELRLRNLGALTIWLGDASPGFPYLPGQSYPVRPSDLIAGYGSDLTAVSRQFTF